MHSRHSVLPHMNFVVDGMLLNELLDQWYPGNGIAGLVPTTLNWLSSATEQAIVWQRFLDRRPTPIIVPILCCPDDLDLNGALVVVESIVSNETVKWRSFGLDHTDFDSLPNGVGASVYWYKRYQYKDVVGYIL